MGRRPEETVKVPIRYETEVNRDLTPTERYATLAHELGHLYCGRAGDQVPGAAQGQGLTGSAVPTP